MNVLSLPSAEESAKLEPPSHYDFEVNELMQVEGVLRLTNAR